MSGAAALGRQRLMPRLYGYLKRHKGLMIGALVLMLLADALQVLHPYLLKVGIDQNISNGDLPGLRTTALLLAGALLSHLIVQIVFTLVVELMGQRLIFDLRMDVIRKVFRLGNDYFDRTPVGATLTNVTNDVEAIRTFISEGIVSILGDTLQVLFILAAMAIINLQLALVTFLVLPLFAIATVLFRNALRGGYRDVRAANSEINTHLVETVTGIREITLLNHQRRSLAGFQVHNRTYLSAFLKVVDSFALYFPTIEVVSNIGVLVILAFSHFALGTTVQVGDIFAFFTYINMLFRPLRQLAEKFNSLQSAMAASERIFAALDRTESIQEPQSPGRFPGPGESAGGIEFRHVGFGYREDARVFEDLSFTIEPGQKVALVGSTGSGKSTAIKLINRLYDVDNGAILLDGTDLKDYPVAELRHRVATVPQDLFLFGGSIADNITLRAPGITRAQAEEAATAVNAHGFIQSLPDGFDQAVLEEGKSLSTGQKQLLSFARAFVLDPRVVIMDEATSSIDSQSERLIDDALGRLLTGRTAIIIAHRLSTIQSVDRILVLHKGQLAEDGTHESLLAADGIYSKLYRMQLLALAG